MKLADPRRARGLLVDGDTSRFTAKEASGMTLLLPKHGDAGDHRFSIALTSNGYLVAGRRPGDLIVSGPT